MIRTLSLLPLFSSTICIAQDHHLELVRNGGFEFLEKEPSTYDQINRAIGWRDATLGLSDLFSAATSARTVGIPENDYGRIGPFEGEHYAGICGWKADIQRNYEAYDQADLFKPAWNAYSEYLHGELIQPLVADSTYEISFHVALAGNSDRTIMGLGALVTEQAINYQHRKFLEESPQVYTERFITERNTWTEVRGTFVADGKEQYITIGVYPYVGLESQNLVEGPDNRYAYYYIDGISLRLAPKAK
ncbi:MAG: hypothetical protein IT225_05035 [Flavobacteriales bacterium]|nr:hypothetical protein [Flavobacteriales bacterium]